MRLAAIRHEAELIGYSDEHLVELAREGGENAIRALIKRNNQRLFRVARAVVCDDDEAEDVVQETYFKAFTKLDPSVASRCFRPGSRGSLSTRRSDGRAGGGPPLISRSWTSLQMKAA